MLTSTDAFIDKLKTATVTSKTHQYQYKKLLFAYLKTLDIKSFC